MAANISGLMTGVSHGTEARLYHERTVLMHCLAGRQTRL